MLSLTRPSQLAKSPKPVLVQIQRQAFDPRWDALISQGQVRAVVSPQGWLVRCRGLDDRGVVAWCDGRETGVGALALQLGRVPPATAADQEQPPLDLNGFRRGRWEFAYGNCTPAVLPQDALRTLLRLERSRRRG